MLFKKIDAASADSVSSGFSFFSIPPTDVSLSKSDYVEILTLNPVSQPPYHFKIQQGSRFIDPEKCYILTEMDMQKNVNGGGWENVVAADNVATIQAPGMNCMKNIKVNIGGRQIYNSNSLQAYKNYMDVILSYSAEVKKSYLALAGYYEDEDSQTTGAGFNARRDLFTDGKTAQFMTKINADLFTQGRYLLNNCDIDIEIQPQDSEFFIVCTAPAANTVYRYKITNMKLYVKYLDTMDGLSLSIAKLLEKQPARYPLKTSTLKSLSLEAGRTEANVNIFTEQIPSSIVCMMVPTADYNGTFGSTPFQANHFNVTDFRMLWNGLQTPSVPYEMRFDTGNVARAFHDLYENTGLAWSPHTSSITLKKFLNGYTFFVFNLTSNLENNASFNLIKEGTTTMHIKFREPIPVGGVTVIIYATFDSLMNIDKNRIVTTDVTV